MACDAILSAFGTSNGVTHTADDPARWSTVSGSTQWVGAGWRLQSSTAFGQGSLKVYGVIESVTIEPNNSIKLSPSDDPANTGVSPSTPPTLTGGTSQIAWPGAAPFQMTGTLKPFQTDGYFTIVNGWATSGTFTARLTKIAWIVQSTGIEHTIWQEGCMELEATLEGVSVEAEVESEVGGSDPPPLLDVILPPQTFTQRGLTLEIWEPTIGSYTPAGVFQGSFGDSVLAWEYELAADGGNVAARFTIGGKFTEIEDWIENGLGRHVVCYAPEGAEIWAGFVDRIEVRLGSLSFVRGPLMEIGNRVSVAYSAILDETTEPPIMGGQTTTIIVEDDDSQAAFGIIEKVVSGGTITDDIAEQIRDTWLAENKWPVTSSDFAVGQEVGELSLVVYCLGYSEWLKAYIYNQTASSLSVTLTTKMLAVLAADPNGLISTNYDKIATNALLTNSYENEDRDAHTIIRELVSQGDINDNRFIFGVGKGQRAYYSAVPTTVRYTQSLLTGRPLISDNDVQINPWLVKAGEYMRFTDFLVGRNLPTNFREDPRVLFIERLTYTAPFGLRLTGGRVSKLSQYLARLGLGSE